MKTDTLLYRLFEDRPELVFELAGLPVPGNAAYRLHAEEVKETKFRFDGILSPPPSRRYLPPVFVETQFQRDDTFYGRWFSEIFIYLFRKHITTDWRAVVIFASEAIDRAETAPYQILLDSPWVRRVHLKEGLPDFDHATVGLRLIHLIVATRTRAPDQARRMLAEHPSERAWLPEWIEAILVYKFPRLTRQEIQQMLNFRDEEFKQTQFYQDVFAEGAEEGRREGHEEGRRQGECTLVLRLLKRRFGSLPDATRQQIESLQIDELEDLAEALLDFSSAADLAAWLGARPGRS